MNQYMYVHPYAGLLRANLSLVKSKTLNKYDGPIISYQDEVNHRTHSTPSLAKGERLYMLNYIM